MGSAISVDPFVENVRVTLLGNKFDSSIENRTMKGINEIMMRDRGIGSEESLSNFEKWCARHNLLIDDHSLLFQKFKEKINTLEFDILLDSINSDSFEKRILQLVKELGGEERVEEERVVAPPSETSQEPSPSPPPEEEGGITALFADVFAKISKEDISNIEEKAKSIFSNLIKTIGEPSLQGEEEEKQKWWKK